MPRRTALSASATSCLAVEQNHGVITHRLACRACARRLSAAQVAEVEVDAGTGQVKVKKLTTVHDSGTVLNHLSYQGQIDGGVVTGLGFRADGRQLLVDGKMSTANLGEFKMPTVTDVPKLTTVLMEDATGPTPYQGKAIAEIPNVPTAAAIAMRSKTPSACGYDLPLTAEKIYAACKTPQQRRGEARV